MYRMLIGLNLLYLTNILSAQEISTIEVAEAYKEKGRINLSTFAQSIEYIQLETSNETLFSYPDVKGIHGDSVILLKSMNRISLFDRNTGRYLRDIGRKGQGPNGFSSTAGSLSFNTDNGNILALKGSDIIQYSTRSGQIVNTTPSPDLTQLGETIGGNIPTQINLTHWSAQGYFSGYIQNINGKEKMKLVLFNSKGKALKLFGNDREYYKENTRLMRMNPVDLFSYDNKSYFKEWYSDTLFSYNTYGMTPEFLFNTGKYQPIYEKQDQLNEEQRSRVMFIDVLTQDHINVYFNLVYRNKRRIGLFNKETKETLISEPESDGLNGFYNDLDNFLPFQPQFRTQDSNLVGIISAEDVYKWFQNNKSQAKKLPDHLRKLENIDPEDNPVVMIVRTKN